MLEFIRKRDGRLVAFEEQNIISAIQKTVKAVGGSDMQQVSDIGRQVVGILEVIYKDGRIPTVENVQDLVEKILIEAALQKTSGRKNDAAKLLGWGRNTLTRKIKELGL